MRVWGCDAETTLEVLRFDVLGRELEKVLEVPRGDSVGPGAAARRGSAGGSGGQNLSMVRLTMERATKVAAVRTAASSLEMVCDTAPCT